MNTNEAPRPLPNCYWVRPGRLLAGEYPGAPAAAEARYKLRHLLQAGIDFFLDLTEADELEPYAQFLLAEAAALGREAQHIRRPIPDLSTPQPADLRQTLDVLDAALAQGRNVYLHCWGGIGRTGLTVGCHLVRHGLSGEQALAQIAAWWQVMEKRNRAPRSPETDAQHAFVRRWSEPGQ